MHKTAMMMCYKTVYIQWYTIYILYTCYKIVYTQWSQTGLEERQGKCLGLCPSVCVSIHLYFCALGCHSESFSFKRPSVERRQNLYVEFIQHSYKRKPPVNPIKQCQKTWTDTVQHANHVSSRHIKVVPQAIKSVMLAYIHHKGCCDSELVQ